MTLRAWRLVPAAVLAWGMAGLTTVLPAAAAPSAVVCWVAALLVTLVSWRRQARSWGVLAVALASAAVVGSHVAVATPSRDAAAAFVAGDGRALVVDVRVTGGVSAGPTGDIWFDAVSETLSVGESTKNAAVPLRVGVAAADAASLAGADLGARVSVSGRSIPPDPGDRAVLVLRADGPVEVTAEPPGPFGTLAGMRAALASSAAGLPAPGAALIPGLATGDTSSVDASLDEAMKASSLSHLTAVSGANCAIVLGMAFGLAALCGLGRRSRIAAGLGALTVFVLLVTPEPSVVRAAAMAAIAMLALGLGRTGTGLATLAAAIVVLLVVDPWLASSAGFALSACATGALLVLARPLADGLSRAMPPALALAVAVPLSAQLVCAPLLVLIDPRIPLLGIVANLLAAPAAPIATIAGFLACLAAAVPVLQDGLVAIAWLPASWVAGVARTVSAIPAQQVAWLEGWPGAATLAALCAAIALVLAGPRVAGPGGRMVRVVALVATAVVIGVVGAQTTLATVAGGWTVPSATWRIAVCDVGQGDAVLVRSAGAVALFDTGPDAALLARCLSRFGVTRIDLLVLTHFDLDHVGGVAAVQGRVDTVLHGPAGEGDARVLDALRRGGARAVLVSAGVRGALGAAQWRVLWPAASVTAPGNDASVVLEVSGDGLPTTVLLGDLSAEPQARLRASVADVDVVKVAHHGSADQDSALYDALSPELALVPVGASNDYGHPRASLLSLLRGEGATIARTDQDGAVAVWREDGVLRLWRERGVRGAQ